MTHPETKLFAELLSQLWNAPWEYDRDEAREMWQHLERLYPTFARREAYDSALPSVARPSCNFAASKQYLYLKPNLDGHVFVPVLSLKCDLEKTPIEIRFRVVIFHRDGQARHAFGMRFEAPEGNGAHDYYHAQFIRSCTAGGDAIPYTSVWVPDTQPSLVLKATGPVSMLAAMLVSLYGFSQVTSLLFPASPRLSEELTKYRRLVEG